MEIGAERNDMNDKESVEEPSRMSRDSEGHENESVMKPVKMDMRLKIKIVLFGQFISLTMATLWSSQSTLYLNCSLSVPAFSNTWVFLFLALNFIPLYREGRRIKKDPDLAQPPHWFIGGKFPLRLQAWKYLGIAFIGVEANYFMMLALKYTTLTSVALFDAVSIPSAMIFSAIMLKRKYGCLHMFGACICLFGLTVNVITDYESDKTPDVSVNDKVRDDGSDHYPDKLLGDLFAILGGALYGINDVFAERCVREYGGVYEYLSMISFWGFLISGIQALVLERQAIYAFFHDGACAFKFSIMLLIIYVICQVIRKVALSRFLLISEAAFLNLSMLTSDLYTTIFSVVAQNIFPRNFFFVGLSMVLIGIFVYEMAPSPETDHYNTTPTHDPPPIHVEHSSTPMVMSSTIV